MPLNPIYVRAGSLNNPFPHQMTYVHVWHVSDCVSRDQSLHAQPHYRVFGQLTTPHSPTYFLFFYFVSCKVGYCVCHKERLKKFKSQFLNFYKLKQCLAMVFSMILAKIIVYDIIMDHFQSQLTYNCLKLRIWYYEILNEWDDLDDRQMLGLAAACTW